MRLFNSLQIVALYAAGPSIIAWLFTGPFMYSNIISWVGVVAYLVMTWLMVAAVFIASKEWEW